MQLCSRSLQEVVAALSADPEEKYDDEETDDEEQMTILNVRPMTRIEKRLSNRNSRKTIIMFRTKKEQNRQRKGADRGNCLLTFRQQT